MAKLVHVCDETNNQNSDALACTLYFDDTPTDAEVKDAIGLINKWVDGECEFKSHCRPDVSEKYFGYAISNNIVSEKAGLVRIQAWD